MRANQESCEAEMSRTAKIAILQAWEKARDNNMKADTVESIERLRRDAEHDVRMVFLIWNPY